MALEVHLVTPEREVWVGEASIVVARAIDGDVGILPGHAPMVAALAVGALYIESGEGRTAYAVDGGFLRPVHPDAERPHGQPDQERSVLGQDAHLPLHPPGDDHGGLSRPDLVLRGDDVHVERHAYPPVPASCFAWASASSMLPTM